ncbi:MAG TPA: MFS transporter [Bacteroidales bacterium]|nr:MFS transporter [Bacteroidales bacterium]
MKNKIIPPGYLFPKGYTNYIFVLLFLLYMFDYIDRMIVTSMFVHIEAAFGITHTQSGLLVSAVYWAIVLLTFPVSILVDRWNRTKTIGVMAVLWSLATALCALTGNFVQLLFTRALIGVGEAGYAPGGTAMISGLYPEAKRSKMMGLWNASIPLGTAIGVLLGGIIATRLGWKHAFGLVALPGFVVAVLFFFVKDYKTVDLSFTDSQNQKTKMKGKDFLREFLSKPSLILTYFGFAAVIFVTTSMVTWLSTYFHVTRDLPIEKAGSMASAVMVLAIVGAPLGGFITDQWRKKNVRARLLFPSISTFLAAIFLMIALWLTEGAVQYLFFLLVGVTVTAFLPAAISVTQDVIHAGLRAMSYAVAVVVQNLLGASMAPVVIGRLYDLYDIKTALALLPFMLLLGAILFFIGSRFYVKDIEKTEKIKLEAQV